MTGNHLIHSIGAWLILLFVSWIAGTVAVTQLMSSWAAVNGALAANNVRLEIEDRFVKLQQLLPNPTDEMQMTGTQKVSLATTEFISGKLEAQADHLVDIAEANGLTIIRSAPVQAEPVSETVNHHTHSISVSGTPQQVLTWLDALNDTVLHISYLSIDASTTGETVLLVVTLTLSQLQAEPGEDT